MHKLIAATLAALITFLTAGCVQLDPTNSTQPVRIEAAGHDVHGATGDTWALYGRLVGFDPARHEVTVNVLRKVTDKTIVDQYYQRPRYIDTNETLSVTYPAGTFRCPGGGAAHLPAKSAEGAYVFVLGSGDPMSGPVTQVKTWDMCAPR